MNTQKIITLTLSLTATILVVAVVIYAQVVWEEYGDTIVSSREESTVADEPLPELTPEENLEILNSLATTSSEGEITLEEQIDILNSLSTTSSASTTEE